jgi:alkylation response protein AidB-like acyl-CoA dehydrogenase
MDRVLVNDRDGIFPREAWDALAEEGWPRRFTPRPWGEGAPLGVLVSAVEGLAYGDTAIVSALQRSACFGGHIIGAWGSEALKADLMPRIASGEALISFALSEPGAGSDAASLASTATEHDGSYVLEGEKAFVGGAGVADTILVAARVGGGQGKSGISLFAVPARSENLRIEPREVLGHRSVGVASLLLDKVVVDAEALVGPSGGGWPIIMQSVARERLQVAAICVGGAQCTLDHALDHAKTRVQFGKPLIQIQAVEHLIAEMWLALESARALLYLVVAESEERGEDAIRSTLAKVVASETWGEVADKGLQVTGGWGYVLDSYMQLAYRESRLYRIGGGTSEVLKSVLAASLARKGAHPIGAGQESGGAGQ